MAIFGILLLACWIDTTHPPCNETDTMVYKLKYVRLRPIHQEAWLRFQEKLVAGDIASRGTIFQASLMGVRTK